MDKEEAMPIVRHTLISNIKIDVIFNRSTICRRLRQSIAQRPRAAIGITGYHKNVGKCFKA
jgi:hypothetical protein